MKSFDQRAFLEEESMQAGELYDNVDIAVEQRDGLFYEIADFGSFKIITDMPKYDAPKNAQCNKMFKIKTPDGKEFNILSLVPKDYKLKTSWYPTAKVRHESKEIQTPKISKKQYLVSALHEVGHAQIFSKLSQNNKDYLQASRHQASEGKISQSQRDTILDDERNAWQLSRKFLDQIGQQLGISVINDQVALETFISRRVQTYEDHLEI
ncbi:MAG: hypothetical protein PHN19_00020 [Patescibacteria group bacterium]|nr:hypothetical protein [Patescibacteria group bacterium]